MSTDATTQNTNPAPASPAASPAPANPAPASPAGGAAPASGAIDLLAGGQKPAAPPAPANDAPWFEAIEGASDELKAHLRGKAYSDVRAALESGMAGDRVLRDRNAMVGPVAGREAEWDGWEKLGWKRNEADYRLTAPKVPEGFDYDPQFEQAFAKLAHQHRVPLGAAQALFSGTTEYFIKGVAGLAEAEAAASQKALDGLKADWGADFDKRLEAARRVVTGLDLPKETIGTLEKAAGGNVAVLQLFDRLAPLFREDTLVTSAGGGGLPRSVEGVRAEIQRLKGDAAFVQSLSNGRDPNHTANARRWDELNGRLGALMDGRSAP